MERKFMRFLVAFSGIIVMIGLAFLIGFNIIPDSEMVDFGTAFGLGIVYMLGQLFYFIAYDLIGECGGFKSIIRGFFLVLAWIITSATSLLVLLLFLSEIKYHLQPWEGAVMAQWITCGLLTYVVYRSIDPEKNRILSAFAPYISLVISYLGNVLVIYILRLVASILETNTLLIILYLLLLLLYCLIIFKKLRIKILDVIAKSIVNFASNRDNEYGEYDNYEEKNKPVKKPKRIGLFGNDMDKDDFIYNLNKEIISEMYEFMNRSGYKGRYLGETRGSKVKMIQVGYANVKIDENGSMTVSVNNCRFEICYGYYYSDRDYSHILYNNLYDWLSKCIHNFIEKNCDLYEVNDYELDIDMTINSYVDDNWRCIE